MTDEKGSRIPQTIEEWQELQEQRWAEGSKLTKAELLALNAQRVAEGRLIDPDNCETFWNWGDVLDPYQDYCPRPDACCGRLYWARRKGGVWIWYGDIPKEVCEKLECPPSFVVRRLKNGPSPAR